MTIQFNYDGVSGSERLENYTKEKLQTIFERYDWVTRADVFFKTENTSSDQTGMISQIRLSAPGPRLFAEESQDNFEEGISKVITQLKTQCEKRKATIVKH
ncbi:HPF/RaiA family ribosome-associated protein [Nonlabens tegetincola]|uniref:HPF/RaiA family ribosome-associated protein n=1 Tax=Nonlabens tegetincola TaxID=323273 RepID=UPI000CF3E065|nr:HPF/RaiA family ribosome-associated protein [Nonlabens tegetincola]PQJ17083.1 30S ribosomal protein S30 [Nonlabens tegetincola]